MAWGRKKRGGRKEPVFGGFAASLAELRLNPLDRVTVADDTPAKRGAPRKTASSGSGGSRERKPPPDRKSRTGRAKKRMRLRLSRLVYWGAVLALWAAIAIVGV